MSFVSYALNCEDVVLWRALRDVAKGIYVDIEESALSPIHFLKIDGKGDQVEVLEGLDLQRVRPWIILIGVIDCDSMISPSREVGASDHRAWL